MDADPNPTKSARVTVRGAGSPIVCSLPPTCAARPTPLASSVEMEAHYAKYHAHVCEVDGCGLVFPDERLLDLHFTECHDSLAATRQARGDKIFECFVPTCPHRFAHPKARRLHLIDIHKYPKQYFFAVTNKGIGDMLRKWGDGASMVRGDWKPREGEREREPVSDDNDEIQEDFAPSRNASEVEDADATVRPRNRNNRRGGRRKQRGPAGDDDVDNLADSMSSLHLVPPAVRFGRGGRTSGFVHPRAPDHDAAHGGAHTGHAQNGHGVAQNGRGNTQNGHGGSQSSHNSARTPRPYEGSQSEMSTDDTMETPRAVPRGLPPHQEGRGRGGGRGGPIRGRGALGRGSRGRGRAL
ncbi:uncharacterized protein SCHCODRAFT_02619945 [Schizophyllum commune H4-8]|uniref:uncharacterized protein n=1 Tax=Schizophyllum commune (strain H4-8 / FGSC 9210) TaxID=578458 RepID=UPI00215E0A6B|nr:uncharacterized protein SCHCODRAFT_02619945 [Schizophyllum commune H4-8]KAI5895626.1 hypothetical protein SCHCODRAFT_02619945 [Schizophyllum commune H4-8]